jgi:hypothetical protein
MSEAENKIEFVESRPRFGEDGSPRRQIVYVYRVSGRNVTVLVNLEAIQTLDGGVLSKDEIILAGRTLIEMEIGNNVDLGDIGEGLVLDGGAMFQISYRLGWRERFYKAAQA